MENKTNNAKKIGIIICAIAICVILFGCIYFTLSSKGGKIDESSSSSVKAIEITYNSSKDFVKITPDKMQFYAFDDNGYKIDEKSVNKKETISKAIDYILKNDAKYLDDKSETKNAMWAIKISTKGKTYYKASRLDAPDWFKELLIEIDAVTYGYIYNREDPGDFTKTLLLKSEKETHTIANNFTIIFNGTRFNDDEEEGEKRYRYVAELVYNKSKLDSNFFNIKDNMIIWSDNYASRFDIIKIDGVYILDSYISKNSGGHYVFVLNTEGVILNSFANVDFKIDKTNKKFTITDCNETCKSSVYSIVEDNIKE